MSTERDRNREGFLDRWSRVKIEAREQAAVPETRPAAKADPQEPAPILPPIEKLTFDSDFSGFFHPKVDEDLRRAALRKLFTDPHFNVMDGLDTYIDDYSKSEPIPAAMLAGMKQAQRILNWAANKPDDDAEAKEGEGDAGQAQVAATEAPPALELDPADPALDGIQQPDVVPVQKT